MEYRLKNGTATVLLCIAAAVVYGEIHDQITVRICLEYFTIGHPLIFGEQPPTVLAALWGVAATWWMGLILGIVMAVASSAGSRPIRKTRTLVKPIAILLAVMAVCACIAGFVGYHSTGGLYFSYGLGLAIPEAKQSAFLADLYAHNASYLIGFFGGLFVANRVWSSRRKLEAAQ